MSDCPVESNSFLSHEILIQAQAASTTAEQRTAIEDVLRVAEAARDRAATPAERSYFDGFCRAPVLCLRLLDVINN